MKTKENKSVTLEEIVKRNVKSTIGRPECKEINENSFIKDFFSNFDVSMKGQESSKMKIRCRLQEILENNTRDSIGSFHSKELNELELINDIFKFFELKPINNEI